VEEMTTGSVTGQCPEAGNAETHLLTVVARKEMQVTSLHASGEG